MKIEQQRVIDAIEKDDNVGFCLACGAEQHNVEPDGERIKCEGCGEHRVFGAEQILLRGDHDGE